MKRVVFTLLSLFIVVSLFAEGGPVIEKGIASWYTSDEAESLTANGELFDPTALSAAHKSLKFGTVVRVTNLDKNKSVDVRINDRGPFVAGRIIDLTPAAAKEADLFESGIANVVLTLLFEPDEPESKYNRAGDTGWYKIQVGSYSSVMRAYTQYDRLLNAGLRPYAELIPDSQTIRLTARWIPEDQLEKTVKVLAALGFAQEDTLKKSEVNPYKQK